MGKKKVRKNRWDHREHLKRGSNRHGNLKAMHPQVRKHLQEDAIRRFLRGDDGRRGHASGETA